MQNNNFIEASGLELARLIREKKATSEAVVAAHVERAKLLNPIINAVVEDRYDKALAEAKAADVAIAKGTPDFAKQRLFGVPHCIKELLAVNGMKSTMGSVHRKDVRSDFDSNALQRIRAEGAILIGTTNVPEAAMWFECDNRVYGPGKNPYDNRRTPGGSSGGEAALIAGGGSPFGVGSDIGGSIRMPAAFCGIFGHKPTEKIVPLTGHYPMTLEVAESFVGNHYPFSVVGPLARKAEDLLFLFDILLGPDGIDRNIDPSFKLGPAVQDWSKVKVFTMADPSFFLTSRTEEDLSEAVIKAGEFFAGLGAEVKEAPKRMLYKSFDHWSTRAWTMEGPTFESYMTGGQHVNYIKEFFNMARGSSHYTFPALLTAWFDQRFSGRDNLVKLTEKLNKFRAHVDELLKDDAILILPQHPRKAPVLDSTIYRPFDYTYTAAFNALGYAATVVPMGLSTDGLPLSVQIVARARMDHLTLSTCLPLEKEFGGWVPIKKPISKENL